MSGMQLADFLLARIAEDEAVARGATPGPWRESNDQNVYGDGAASNEPIAVGPWNGEVGDSAAHIARHDPVRVLAECEAKRRIVAAEGSARVFHDMVGEVEVRRSSAEPDIVYVNDKKMSEAEFNAVFTEPAPPSQVLLLLALPYADHPDYQEEWRA